MKFSIIVPVYNVEKYIEKCLKSILKQTYSNFELIVVNDGSPDNSQKIIDKYSKKDKRIKSFIKENGGLSDARNYGLEYATGDYILFVDSDDYLDESLLEKLNETLLKEKVDVLRFECSTYDEEGNLIASNEGEDYIGEKVDNVIKTIVRNKFVEPAWLYCYSSKFWKKNKFKYEKGKIHEDFGLTPIILYEAGTISSINYNGYCYLIRNGSITNNNNYEKTKKAVYDMLEQGKKINKFLKDKPDTLRKMAISSYVNECLIVKGKSLNSYDQKIYFKELKSLQIAKNIYPYNSKKRFKRIISSVNYKLYLRLFVR